MSLAFPTINLREIFNSRQNTRDSWDADFHANHKAFANTIANAIAYEILTKFKKEANNPYNSINDKCKISEDYFFNITSSNTVERIVALIKGIGETPSPFGNWFEVLDSSNAPNTPDQPYFKASMAKVGAVVESSLLEIFKNIQSEPDCAKLKFRVVWCEKAESIFESDLWLKVELWISESKMNTAS